MANVTNPVIPRGPQGGKETEALTPAEAERVLVRRAQDGDVTAYEELVRIHQQRVLGVIGGILRGSEDVEDVAQQALAKAYFSIRRFDMRSAFGTWLYKIAVNECWDYLRKKKVRRLVYESDLSEEQLRKMDASPEHGFSGASHRQDAGHKAEQRQLVERLLGQLDEKDQLMLVMKEIEGFSVRSYENGTQLLDDIPFPGADCLIVDYRLPGLNGLDLLAELRRRHVALPAILVTTHPGA